MKKSDKIYVAGHEGLVGSAITHQLKRRGFKNIINKISSELDLTNQDQVQNFFNKYKPDYVFLAAGKSGGIYANDTYRAELVYDNLSIQTNVIHQAYLHEVKKLIFFGCSTIYPQKVLQPMKEEYLLSAHPEPGNESLTISKLAGLEMCEAYNRQYGTNFISVIPSIIYGRNQSYETLNSSVIPALIKRFHEAKKIKSDEVVVWGTGRTSRDFLFVDDLADAVIFLMEKFSGNEIFNIATGSHFTIAELAQIIKEIVDYKGDIVYDAFKPEGSLIKYQDISKINALGWKYKVELRDGLEQTYNAFRSLEVNQ